MTHKMTMPWKRHHQCNTKNTTGSRIVKTTSSTHSHQEHTINTTPQTTHHHQQHTLNMALSTAYNTNATTKHHPHKTIYNRPCFPFLTFPSAPPQKGGHSIHIPNFQNTISTKASTQRCSNTALATNHKKTTPLLSFYLERFFDPRIFAS